MIVFTVAATVTGLGFLGLVGGVLWLGEQAGKCIRRRFRRPASDTRKART